MEDDMIPKEIPEEFEEHKEKSLKKVIIGILGIFLIGLILSYFLVYSGPNEEILLGLIGTSTITNNIVKIDDITIEFVPNIYLKFIEHYLENDGNEIKVCFLGEKRSDKLFIDKIVFPEIISQSYRHVTTEPCPDNTLISLHSHPNRQCLPSDQDVKSYELLKPNNPDLMVAILCEKDRLKFYS